MEWLSEFDEPARELFIFCILLNRVDMAMLFWDEGKVILANYMLGWYENTIR